MTESATVGVRQLADELPLWVVYPASGAPAVTHFGPYAVEVVRDGELAVSGRLAAVAISHGNGGSPWTHRGTALALARAGFVVVLVEHLGNSRSDNSLANTPAMLAKRPRQLAAAIDALYADRELGPRLTARVGAIGHSIGAYTALALAGGRPHSLPNEEPDHHGRPIDVPRDDRLAALALLAPAAVWFHEPGSLDAVTADVLLRTGERDDHALPVHRDVVVRRLPAGRIVDDQVVDGAGHFSFQSVFPPALTRPDFPPAHDPPGFDRARYLPTLDRELIAFFRPRLAVTW